MALGKNLKRIREAKGLTQDKLSALTGGKVSQGAIAALENRDSISSRFTTDLAVALGVPVEELLGTEVVRHASVGNLAHARQLAEKAGGGGQIHILGERGAIYAHHPDDQLPEDTIAIKESRLLKFSAGNGHRVDFELIEESEPAIYRLSWLQREGLNPDFLRRFKVCGDSMEPFLYNNDSVLVNLAENNSTRIIDGKVYALRYGEDLRIKRLFRKLDGTLTLRSDNAAYKDEDVPPTLAEEHITLIGRVRDKSGSGGL